MTKVVHIQEMKAQDFWNFLLRNDACGGGKQIAEGKSLSYALQICQNPAYIAWVLGEMCAQNLAKRTEVVALLLDCADYIKDRLKIDFPEVDFVIQELRAFTRGERDDAQVYKSASPLDKEIGNAHRDKYRYQTDSELAVIGFKIHFATAIRNILSLTSFVNTNAIAASCAMAEFSRAHISITRASESADYIDRVYAQFLREGIEVVWW